MKLKKKKKINVNGINSPYIKIFGLTACALSLEDKGVMEIECVPEKVAQF